MALKVQRIKGRNKGERERQMKMDACKQILNLKFQLCRDVTPPKKAFDSDAGIDFYIPNDLKQLSYSTIFRDSVATYWDGSYGADQLNEAGYGYLEWNNAFYIHPFGSVLIPSGVKIAIPDGWGLLFANKSGVCTKKGLIVGAQVIDSAYRGEVHIHLINTRNISVSIDPGEKIIQGLVIQIPRISLEQVDDILTVPANDPRGSGGFGSTDLVDG